MLRKILFVTLLIACVAFSTKSFSQTKSSGTEIKEIASTLVECYFTLKAYSMSNSINCATQLTERISGLNSLVQTKVDQNKTFVTQKIGAANFKELQNFIKGCRFYSGNSEELTTEHRGSLMLWISAFKEKIEELFIKLNK